MVRAFVLPGGASLGAVQVGMVQALADERIEPDLVIGASVGSLNGAVLATRPGAEGLRVLDSLWRSVRRKDIFPLRPLSLLLGLSGRRNYVMKSGGLRRMVEAHVGGWRLEDTLVPFHVMATELMSGQPVVLSAGDTVTALMASTALPGIFPPVEVDGRLLVDGGIAADTPIAQAVHLEADEVWVLATVADPPAPPRSAPGMALQAIGALIGQIDELHVATWTGLLPVRVVPPPPTAVSSPIDLRDRGRLIDDARASTRSWLAAGANPAPAPLP
jgi:NTE family protein